MSGEKITNRGEEIKTNLLVDAWKKENFLLLPETTGIKEKVLGLINSEFVFESKKLLDEIDAQLDKDHPLKDKLKVGVYYSVEQAGNYLLLSATDLNTLAQDDLITSQNPKLLELITDLNQAKPFILAFNPATNEIIAYETNSFVDYLNLIKSKISLVQKQ